jgi:death on curing protein
MILIEDILELHSKSITNYGGANGIRDLGLLESAIARPYQTYGGEYLYLTELEKAAALGESLIKNHPFVDGNKRTGVLAMLSLLLEFKIKTIAKEEDLYNFTISISTGEIHFEQIVSWLKENTTTVY